MVCFYFVRLRPQTGKICEQHVMLPPISSPCVPRIVHQRCIVSKSACRLLFHCGPRFTSTHRFSIAGSKCSYSHRLQCRQLSQHNARILLPRMLAPVGHGSGFHIFRAIASVITLVVSIGYIRLLPQASAFQASCLCIACGIDPAVYRIPNRGPTPISLSAASIMRSHLFI